MKLVTEYDFFRRLTALPFVKAIYLYGSRARGDGLPLTDIDLAIECPGATAKQWSIVRDIIEAADTLLKIDCLRYDTIENPQLLAEINRDKIQLYAK